jgi:hypothetical protein
VALFTHLELPLLVREASSRAIHRVEQIAVFRLQPEFLDALAGRLEKNSKFELVHTDGQLYVTLGAEQLSGTLSPCSLVATG